MAKKSTKRTVTVDFEGVESGGRSLADGTYLAEITEAVQKESKSSGEPMIVLKWKVVSGKGKGVVLYDNCSLQPQALWKLKGLLEALGEDVPDSTLDLDLDDLVERQATVVVTNEKYEGKDRPRITEYASAEDKADDDDTADDDSEDDEDDPDDEDAPETTAAKRGRPKKVKIGAKVSFKDEKKKVVKGVIDEIDGDQVKVTDVNGDEWELEVSDLTVL